MCCIFTILVFLGPRFGLLFWWIAQPNRFDLAFNTFIWPFIGFLFVPWMTLMFVLVAPGGVEGFEWVWLGLALAFDIIDWVGGGWRHAYRIPAYSGPYAATGGPGVDYPATATPPTQP